MDALAAFLEELRHGGHTQGNFLGFLNVLIGRTITRHEDSVIISKGLSWRDLANGLKKARWDPEAVRELGLDPDDLPPRDRQRFWYGAIAHAHVDARQAVQAGERFVELLRGLGYAAGPAPHA